MVMASFTASFNNIFICCLFVGVGSNALRINFFKKVYSVMFTSSSLRFNCFVCCSFSAVATLFICI